MRRLVEIGALCALVLSVIPASAMTLGARTLLHGHAVARQLAETEPLPQVWCVTFDANGGVIGGTEDSSEATRVVIVTNGCEVGALPKATRRDYVFEGWFASADGGEQADLETVITSDRTFYAHWRCRFEFGDGDVWTQLPDGSWESGVTADGATNSLSVTVNGAGTVCFQWRTSCEDYFNFKGTLLRQDGLSFFVDGEERCFANGIMSDWGECSFAIETTGDHTLVWSYIKDILGGEGEDRAWICAVAWTPNVEAGLAVWLAERNLTAESRAANGRTAAECYALGLDPADATNDLRIVSIELVDGKPKVEWAPKTNRWTGVEIQAVLKGAEALDGEWQTVTEENKAGFRFFKVVVEVP